MIKTITVLCLVAAAVLVGCQNDESTVAPTTTNQNNAPNTQNSPSPADGATGVNRHVVFSWSGGDPDAGDTTRYDLFYGSDQNPRNLAVSNTLNTVFDFGLVEPNFVVYWRIRAR